MGELLVTPEIKDINLLVLINELAAKFYLSWEEEQIAQAYLTEAYYCYARWVPRLK